MRTSSLIQAVAAFLLVFLTPLFAHAEPQDLGEVVHAVFIVGIFVMMFLAGSGLGIWLIIQRLRSSDEPSPEKSAPHRLNLEGIYFPTATSVAPPSASRD